MVGDFLLFTGLCLGIRHGFDLDHVTAIADLVGSKLTSASDVSASPVPTDLSETRPAGLRLKGYCLKGAGELDVRVLTTVEVPV